MIPYLFKRKGLNLGKIYRVTFDTTGDVVVIPGWVLARDGLSVRLEFRTSSESSVLSAISDTDEASRRPYASQCDRIRLHIVTVANIKWLFTFFSRSVFVTKGLASLQHSLNVPND